jgi:soluble lytic murein transglycosylase-like protein
MTSAYDALISSASIKYGVPETWIRAFIMTESSFNPQAYRAEPQINDASYGLMQLLYKTAKGLGYGGMPEGLYDPGTNIDLGVKLMSQGRAKYGDDIQAVYSFYNSGSGTKYLTVPGVAQHVANMLRNFEQVLTENPVIATTGTFGVVVVALLIWYWTKSKK